MGIRFRRVDSLQETLEKDTVYFSSNPQGGLVVTVVGDDPSTPLTIDALSLIDDDLLEGQDKTYSIARILQLLNGKVNVVAGRSLSEQNYTQAEKDKLATLESSKYRGLFTSLDALDGGVESPMAGDYADVDEGPESTVRRFIRDYNNGEWVEQASKSAPLTAAMVKGLYESNDDTNAYDDDAKQTVEDLRVDMWGDGGEVNGVVDDIAYLRGRDTATNNRINSVEQSVSTKLDASDERLLNDREWLAPTATAVEAASEEGSERRAWTVTRLIELCTAWWNRSAMKTKLDGIQAGANNYSHPTGNGYRHLPDHTAGDSWGKALFADGENDGVGYWREINVGDIADFDPSTLVRPQVTAVVDYELTASVESAYENVLTSQILYDINAIYPGRFDVEDVYGRSIVAVKRLAGEYDETMHWVDAGDRVKYGFNNLGYNFRIFNTSEQDVDLKITFVVTSRN